jgi:hypothetical protein
VQPPDPGAGTDDLFSVAVLSRGDAWAVGDDSSGGSFRTPGRALERALLEGRAQPGPGARLQLPQRRADRLRAQHLGGRDYSTEDGGIAPNKTLILHWNGTSWKQVASPSPSSGIDDLNGVHVVSARDIWAVGADTSGAGHDRSLILRWNGSRWRQVASLDPGTTSNVLTAVTSTSRGNAWAVGNYRDGHGSRSLVLRWNGTRWKRASSPNPAGSSELESVSATSAKNAWAVGDEAKGLSVTLHWNGRTWAHVASPDILPADDDNILEGVVATSASNAWAVGQATIISTGTAFELHWNGRKWTNMASPTPGDNSAMFAVAATSASNAWTVGEFSRDAQATAHRALAFRCR